MIKSGIISILFLIISIAVNGQNGGEQDYTFLNQTNIGARTAAMGGDFLTINDDDIALALGNPSLISKEMHNQLNINLVDYYNSINYGYVSYGRSFEKYGNFVGSIQYINYGKFKGTDYTGEETGDFYANDLAMNIGWARPLSEKITLGVNTKIISSFYEQYSSYGAGVDLAANYYDPDKKFSSSLIVKNLGRTFKAYETGTDWLPFEIQLGLSKRLEHIPFTYSILINHLQQWDLRYDDPNEIRIDPLTKDSISLNSWEEIADNLARHIVLGGEFQIHKNFAIRMGYNYKRRQEMKVDSRKRMVGFSWGFSFRVKRFHFAYARSTYHLAGSPNFISITTNLSDMFYKTVEVPKE